MLDTYRLMGVEIGGCPHTATRKDAYINLEAIDCMLVDFHDADVLSIESGGDNLAATFSPGLSDLTINVDDVAAGGKFRTRAGLASSKVICSSSTKLTWHRI